MSYLPHLSRKQMREAIAFDAQVRRETALAAGSRRAKTAQPVECEASQSGAKRNAQRTPHD